MELAESQALWAEVALSNVVREFPHVELCAQNSPDDRPDRPSVAHPAFYGSYDWHSSVEMHWLLVRLLRTAPGRLDETRIRERLASHLSPAALATEARNLPRSERPYGFAWALMLAEELASWDDSDAAAWTEAMGPLTARIVAELERWLSVANYPVRIGMHSNSAFALSLSLRFARKRAVELAERIEVTARRWFLDDRHYPGHYEPSGTDFLSPALTEAELMTEVLGEPDFSAWLSSFLPRLEEGSPAVLFSPVSVSDPSDGQLAHLHGLNLSRAWCWRRIGEALPAGDPRQAAIGASVTAHRKASITEAVGSDYMVEHWLAAYAVLLTS